MILGPINAADGLTIKVSKPWSYERNLGNLSTAIFIQRNNQQNVKTLAMKIQPKQTVQLQFSVLRLETLINILHL